MLLLLPSRSFAETVASMLVRDAFTDHHYRISIFNGVFHLVMKPYMSKIRK